jgi:glycerol-3-phosphate acyltransferase PlsY
MKLIARKTYRIGAGIIFPLVYYFSTNKIIVEILLFYLMGMMTVIEIMRRLSPNIWKVMVEHSHGILREKEGFITGTMALLLSNAIVIAFFDKWVAIISLLFMLFGDTAASVIGLKYGKVKIGDKTLEGSLSFFITTIAIALIFYKFVPIHLIVLIIGAVVATIVEALPLKINDNLTVAIASAIAMQIFVF